MKNTVPTLSHTSLGVRWVSQFKPDDQGLAAKLLDSMLLVSADEFIDRLEALVEERAVAGSTPIGLYAEREIRKHKGIPNRLFEEISFQGRVRAVGAGLKPVQSPRTVDPEVGSEGLIALVITGLCRKNRSAFISHPGPDQIRKRKVRTFLLLTDFIGSGRRARDYLDAAWRIASVKSWWSFGWLRFEVAAYSATDAGKAAVEGHPSRPTVHLVAACPTISTEFTKQEADTIRALCIEYDPVNHVPDEALGFQRGQALIAFAHGCPNNVPRILHKKAAHWLPLFSARVPSRLRVLFGDRRDDASLVARLAALRERRLAKGGWLTSAGAEGRWMILLLAALRRGPRFDEALARRTGLTVVEVRAYLASARKWKWITQSRHVTDLGLSQLEHARKYSSRKELASLPLRSEAFYYPKSLRAPNKSI